MGYAVAPILDAMGVAQFTVDDSQELEAAVDGAVAHAFDHGGAAALVLSQDILGVKEF
jgi:sulfopyruvate decarboxylase TPP-binding subunit